MTITDRKGTTEILTKSAKGYWVKKKYSVHQEIGVIKWGRLKVDLLAINLSGDLVIVEVKSCHNDFIVDSKWHSYLDKCHRFYFCISEQYFLSKKSKYLLTEAKLHGAGVMVLNSKTGFLNVRLNAKKRKVEESEIHRLALKMLWRYGANARNTRRTRQFI